MYLFAADVLSNGALLDQPMQSGINLETLYSTVIHVATDAEIPQPGQSVIPQIIL
jgi:hypothetical protein